MTKQELLERALSPTMTEKVVREIIDLFLIPKHKQLGMEATGKWIQSLHAQGTKIRGMKYTEQLEYGRRPGKFAPIAPLIRWAEAKLGLSGQAAISAAYAVNHKIQQEGTSWYKSGGSDLMEVLESPEVIEYANRRFGELLKHEVRLYVSQEVLVELKNKLKR